MEQHEARLFDLLESKDFAELTNDELAYVSEYLTEEEYTFQQQLIRAAQDWAPEYDVEPLPLVLPATAGPLKRTIPLYQALLAVAAVVLLFIVIRPFRETIIAPTENNQPVQAKVKTEVVHDTVVQYITKVDTVVLREKAAGRQEVVYVPTNAPSEFSLPVAENSLELPELNEAAVRNSGQSMRNDETYQLIPAGRGW